MSDPRIPTISIHHEGPEEYENMWQKSRSIWKFVGTHYLEDFDFFYLGGDDLFAIPQNLKRYLQEILEVRHSTADDDFYVGRRFKGRNDTSYFNSGGPGYVLSRGALRKYVNIGWNHPNCSTDAVTAAEDVMMAKCMKNVFDIDLIDTRDEQLRERFHHFSPQFIYRWKNPENIEEHWYAQYNEEWKPLEGLMCCSPSTVSFHYVENPVIMRHLHALSTTCHRDLKEQAKR